MKTRFSILSALLCLFAVSSWADTTTDHVTLPELTINPGGDYLTVTASVENISNYSAFGLDIYLPEGYEFVQLQLENEDEELEWMYASKGAACKTTHSCKSKIQEDGALRVTVYSSSSATFKTTSNELFNFYIKAPSYAKPGDYVDVQIKNCFFTTAAAVQYDVEDTDIPKQIQIGTSGSLAVSVSGTYHWSTFISPFACAIPDGINVYKYSRLATDENVVYVKQQSKIEAYTPYVLYAENDFSETLTGTIDASKYQSTVTDGLLVGVIEKQSVSAGYVLQNLDEGVKFYTMGGSTFTIPAGKCYLLPASSSKLSIAFEDETDGINDINANANDDVYDLQGRKLQNPQQRGIYIVNGKKVVKK